MKYLSISETSEIWGISRRRIQVLCNEGRVPGALRIGVVWALPENAQKPSDARVKSGKYIGGSARRQESEKLSEDAC